MSKCISCLQGFTWECVDGGSCGGAANESALPVSVEDESEGKTQEEIMIELLESSAEEDGREVRTQDDSKLRDQQSTGRKRAAVMYPLHEDEDCDWKMKKNCGGGSKPIIGCKDGKQQARHHGPDKNTLNNSKGNVHRICHTCHNRWHTENDEDYIWGSVYDPHSPSNANEIEIFQNEFYWTTRSVKKAKD